MITTREIVEYYLQKNRKNISDLAESIGAVRSTVSYVIRGKRRTYNIVDKIAQTLGINREKFLNLYGHTTKTERLKEKARQYFENLIYHS